MKHYLNYLAAVMLAVLSVSLAGCGSDSDEPENTNPQSLLGTWECDLVRMGIDGMGDIYEGGEELMQLRADGTMVSVHALIFTDTWAAIDGQKEEIEVEYDTWRVEGNKLILGDGDGQGDVCTYKLQGDKLTMTGDTPFGQMTITCTRVSDARIEKYL